MAQALTIRAVGQGLRSGRVTVPQLVEACLQKIRQAEPEINAWAIIDTEGSIQKAHKLQQQLDEGIDLGPLHGIPLGIKDIIDVEGLPTVAGAEWRRGHVATRSAECVQALVDAGAVVLGKTVTTQFALYDPSSTKNPLDLNLTPGGSSSGSAAAVASGMCLAAIGTQTGGSIIRPASYCGITGLKPSHDEISKQGVIPIADTLDHVGVLANTVDDCRLVYDILKCKTSACVPQLKKLLRVKGHFFTNATAEIQEAFESAVGALEMQEFVLPLDTPRMIQSHSTIVAYEISRFHEASYNEFRDYYRPNLSELIIAGSKLSLEAYEAALEFQVQQRQQVESWLDNDIALVMPATDSFPPKLSANSTGSPVFSSPWSFLGTPSLSFPISKVAGDVPVCVQIVARNTSTAMQAGDSLQKLLEL